MKIKRDKRDAIFSLLVRERCGWRCERCGRVYLPHSRGLQCAHTISRRYRGTRWLPENAHALCTGCHMHFTGCPLDFAAWIEERLGKDRAASLRSAATKVTKFTKADLDAIYSHLKAEHKRLLDLRQRGAAGRIEFAGWAP